MVSVLICSDTINDGSCQKVEFTGAGRLLKMETDTKDIGNDCTQIQFYII